MSGRGAPRLGLILLLLALAAATVAPGAARAQEGDAPPLGESGIRADARLLPRIVLFGDTVRAVVDVTVDSERFDPETVRVGVRFSPWEVIGAPERVRRDAGRLATVRTTYAIRCMKSPCVPAGSLAPLQLPPARVTVSPIGEAEGKRERLSVAWPLLAVNSRFASVRFEDPRTAVTPWRADVASLPAVSYRVPPQALAFVLLGVSLLLGGAGGALAFVAWPRRAPAPPPEPEPEPLPSLTPLEQALALLEESARVDGASEQRRALELVAEELDEWGDADLAQTARVLAWSEGVPGVEQTNALAARVRAELEQELLARAEPEPNGDGRAG